MKKLENALNIITHRYTQIERGYDGCDLNSTVDKVKLTEELLEKFRELKFCAENASSLELSLGKNQINDNNKITSGNDRLSINATCVEGVLEALKKIKKYPKHGQVYYDILTDRFIGKKLYTYEMLAKKRKCSKRTLITKKDEAIKVLSLILWGDEPDETALIYIEKTLQKIKTQN